MPFLFLPLAIVGLIDDKFNISQKWRFSFQILTSLLLILNSGIYENNIISQNSLLLSFITLFFIVISIIALINFINFMDGLDGLVASNLIIIFISIALITNLNTNVVIGVISGFLVWNWSPAKVFMGDAGSTFLGALLSSFILQINRPIDILGVLLVSAPLLGDAFFSILRRLINGQNIFLAHKQHLYQRLYQAGLSKSKICIIYNISSLTILFSLINFGIYFAIIYLTLICIFGFYLDKKFASDFI